MSQYLTGIILLLLITACNTDTNNTSSDNDRPLETWAFRCVLDEKPRMFVAALHKDLYVAYDTKKAKMYKAWKGIVNFEGAVFDGAHGPQPTSVGDAYYIDDSSETVWQLNRGSDNVEFELEYKGHKYNDGRVALMYELSLDNGDKISISESPEYEMSETGQLRLDRAFETSGIPADMDLYWSGPMVLVDKSQAVTSGELEMLGESDVKFEDKSFIKYDHRLRISNGMTSLNIPMLAPLYLDPNIADGFNADDESLPRGAQLIGKNDCKTCHNVSKQTVGPSYMDIAKKYEHNDENKIMLVNKIKSGGSGVWGEQVMTPHPEIPDHDLKEMVDYIFSLAAFAGQKSESAESNDLIKAIDLEEGELIPGSVTQVFKLSTDVEKMPTDLEDREPFQAGVLPAFNNISGGDFKELDDFFALMSKGVLKIEETGNYGFRLWSDDGSKLYLHDKLVIDNDGMHGTEMKQANLYLEKGYHPFMIEFFQGGGGKFLSFNMKGESDEAWKTVPSVLISHLRSDQEYLTELSLPMSVITRIPGDGVALEDVHPSFDIYQARPDDFEKKIGGLDFLADGRLIVSVWEKEGAVYIIDNHDAEDASNIKATKIAEGLAEPLGLKVVGDRIFVMQKQEMTELVDTNGDEIIDEYRTLCDDWGVTANFHEFGFGLEEKDGYLYANLATGILPGGAGMPNQHPDRGSCIKVSIEDGSFEVVANGLRTPNGVGRGYNDEIFVSDNQGDWLPSSKIVHIEKGDWFGSRAVDFEGTKDFEEKKPVVWLPQDEIGNSPSTPLALNVGPYKNQMIHGEVTHGGVKRLFVEEVDGQLQGCVFRFIQGMEAGVNRLRWAANGDLYSGGIGNPGNWQHSGKNWFGLERLRYNGESAFEMLAVRAMSNGIEIEFTEALKEGDGWMTDDYEVRQWYYEPTADYGGPKIDDKRLTILSANVSDDRKKVFLELEGMRDDHVVYVRLKNHFVSEEEHSLWSTEAWYTMNKIPGNKPGKKSETLVTKQNNMLTELEKEQGWKLLFDGVSFDGWRGYKKDGVGDKWLIEDGTMSTDTTNLPNGRWQIEGSNDIITVDQYENFELNLEWKIQNCGNSGIFFLVQELEEYHEAYFSGPEMQILDNVCHVETRNPTHRAGDLYDLIECRFIAVKPAGEWNKVRLILNNGKVEHWLNGYKMLEYELWTDEWNEMIANSKFKDWPMAKTKKGHIALQEHDDKVWFRNIKIKAL